ncbi:hypothetical protein [Serratia fonticola]
MNQRIIVTNNNYLVLGLMHHYPSVFSFLSYDKFFSSCAQSDYDGKTYIFDVSISKYEIINVVHEIKVNKFHLNKSCIILWGRNTDIPSISRLGKINFYDIKCISNKLHLYESIERAEMISKLGYDEKIEITYGESLVLKQLLKHESLTTVAGKLGKSIKTISAQKRSVMLKFGFGSNVNLFVFMKTFL